MLDHQRSERCARPSFASRGLGVVTATFVLSASAASLAQTRLYDDFSFRLLDPDKWEGTQFPEVQASGLEIRREAQRSKLLMRHRIVGETVSDTAVGSATSVLRFRDGEAITAVQFDVNVHDMTATGCEVPGGAVSHALVRSRNILFRGASGDVDAVIDVFRASNSLDSPRVLRIQAFVAQSGQPPLGVIDLGTIRQNETVTLRMAWLPDQDRVEFQRDSEPSQSVGYALDDTGPRSEVKDFELLGFVANCTAGPRPFVSIGATIDNVFVDP